MGQKACAPHLPYATDRCPIGADRVGLVLFIGNPEKPTQGKEKHKQTIPVLLATLPLVSFRSATLDMVNMVSFFSTRRTAARVAA
jgi:hypothetical protein